MTAIRAVITMFILFSAVYCFSQSRMDSLLGNIDPQKLSAYAGKKAEKLEIKLTKKSEKALSTLQSQEEKIYRKLLSSKDSLQAKAKLSEVKEKYAALREKLQNSTGITKTYISKLDTLTTSFKLLRLPNLDKIESLQGKFDQAETIKEFIKQRREQLKQELLNLGLLKQLKQYNKTAYYYAEQIKEYKEILKDPKKIEKKTIELLSKTKLFQDFFRKNSMLASLFRISSDDPNDPAYIASLRGLQTRNQVNALIQQQIQSAGTNGMQQFRQQMQSAQAQLNQLKNNVLSKFPHGGGNSTDIMPDGFKPNTQKAKSFWKRLELGTNLQTQKATSYFPTTTDIGLSLGYKINDKSIMGVGGSFKAGLGRGWDHIRFTGEGASIRSFIDVKLKGSFWLTGGFELNYKPAFNRLDILKHLSSWQRSGLMGLSKSIPIKTKFFKQTKMQLLWDMLARDQEPQGQQFVFRVGYTF